jgi:hypothetical protein
MTFVQKGRTPMADSNEQQRGREEDLMARGPVSADASNKSAPMNQGQQPASPETEHTASQQENADYNKMIVDRSSGTMTGSGMETDRDLGTVGGATRDRGSMQDVAMDTSTNTENMINRQSQGNIGGRNPGQPQTAMGDRDNTRRARQRRE